MASDFVSIGPGQLAQKLRESRAPVVVDVRLEDDYAASHIPGAKSNCVFEVDFPGRLEQVAPDRTNPVCVYGTAADSYEARMAAQKLCRNGYAEVFELREGIEGWKAAGFPVEGERGVGAPSTADIPDGVRGIDLAESHLEWTGRNLLNKHHGTLGLKDGTLRFENGRLAGGEFTLDMQSITCADLEGDPLRDVLVGHLKSHDFFDVELYPEGRFVILQAEPVAGAGAGAPNLAVKGELTLKGITGPVEFVASAGLTPEGKPAAQAVFSIDRTRWNVLYGSGRYFRNLAGHLVNDQVEIQLRIVAG